MRRKIFKIASYVLVAAVFIPAISFAATRDGLIPLPEKPSGYVTDLAGIIGPEEERAINSFAAELERKTTAEVAVVTLGTTKPENIHNFSMRLFDKWRVGKQGKDNGVLIVVAIDDQQGWISTGYGIEGIIPDAVASKIVRDIMAPSFRNGKYSEGMLNGAVAVISLIAKDSGVEVTGKEGDISPSGEREATGFEVFLTLLLFLLVFSMRSGLFGYFLFGSMVGGRRRGGHWYGAGSGSSGGSFGGFGGFGGGMSGGGGGGGGW